MDFYLPYLLNYSQLTVEGVAIFCVSVLIAVLVSAEGQGFAATLLGDSQPDAKDRFHFNVFLHLDPLGTICFFIAGFGWAKEIKIKKESFKRGGGARLILSRLAGPLANLLMANIAASLAWLLRRYGFVDTVFSTIAVVNVTMAVYSMLIVPPLPGAAFLSAFFPVRGGWAKTWKYLRLAGPYLLLGTFLAIRLSGWTGLAEIFNPLVSSLTVMIINV